MIGPLKKRRPAAERAGEQPTSVVLDPTATPAAPPPAPGVPAGLEPRPVVAPGTPSFRDRGRLRRRLRYLRRVRELGFRDLGGLVFDLHRFGREGPELVGGKLAALGAVDAELRALEAALDDRREFVELREPGIAACPRCGGLHGSDARFCPSCGVRLGGPLAFAEVAEGASATGGAPAPGPGPQASDDTLLIRPVSAAQAGGAAVSAGQAPVEAPPVTEAEQPTEVLATTPEPVTADPDAARVEITHVEPATDAGDATAPGAPDPA